MVIQETYLDKIELELKQTPAEYLPALLTIIHAFRESVCPDNVAKGFETSWQEMLRGEYQSVDTLWDDIEP
ncbi:MAG: hypothetical protein Q8Q50_10835 [Methylobacter sp.]|jgi:hypothetical protein|nr:hypothetical protein [Methylobacter sp.]